MSARVISPTPTSSTEPPVRIIWSDAQVVVVDKPAGLPSQSDRTGDHDLLSLVRAELKDDAIQLVHRLDRPVGGVLVFARTPEAIRSLNAQFKTGQVQKSYQAIVEGRYDAGALLQHTIRHDGAGRKARSGEPGLDRKVELTVRVLGFGERYSLLEVRPDGGAFHQIRVQLSMVGHPIKGDVKYGARRGEKDRSIALHACSITFRHPVTDSIVNVTVPVPGSGLWHTLRDPIGS